MAPEYPKEKSFKYQMPNLNIPNPPDNLSYVEFEDYRNREILKANGITTSEAELMDALEVKTNILQAAAAHILGTLASKAAIPTLKKRLRSTEDLVRVEAAYALARLKVSEGKEVLVQCLNYPLDAYLFPAIAAGYLAQLGDPQGFQTVVKCFDFNISAIRMLACKQLYFYVPFQDIQDGDGNAIDVYRLFDRALKDSDTNIQWQALVQLREICSPKSRSILENYIENIGNEQLRDIAKGIVARIAELDKKRDASP
jgi:hypothetical protein